MRKLLLKFIGFGGVGGVTTLLSMAMIAVTNEIFHWNPQVSYVVSYVLTLLLSYVLNSIWVFHSKFSWRKITGYCGAYISGMLLGMVLLKGVMLSFPHWNATLLSCMVIPVTLGWNFIFVNIVLTAREKTHV